MRLLLAVPVMMIASALPEAQPGRLKTSCRTEARFVVRSLGPLSSAAFQATGTQETEAVVLVRDDMLLAEAAKVGALSMACA